MHSVGHRECNRIGGSQLVTIASLTLLVGAVAAQQQPTQQEQNLFSTVRTRMEGHAAQMPHAVNDASTSLGNDCWGMSFPCPRDSAVSGVTFVVCTRLVAWQANQADPMEAAAYIWDSHPMVMIANNIKTIRYNNQLMIDTAVFGPNESLGALGRTLNEGLLYHEFLHGQLGIEWLKTQAPRNDACRCNTPDPGPHTDPTHAQISDLQDTFLANVAALDGNNVRVIRQRIPAGGNGQFTINLGSKDHWTGTVRLPRNGNVKGATVSDPHSDGTIVLMGSLDDPKAGGVVLVLIDPDSLFLYFFIGISTGAAPVPVSGGTATVIAILVLFLIGAAGVAHTRIARGAVD